ncbi:uncharacterized protein N7469_003989 [Penicillium citrinum]|uniref:1-phosphatidylinositol-3-phosphate 5-kinase n=1 Tax=Penicillium citrinum TaxID=5077 RepID=A0A9W9P3Y3_PENCI|nr:uncharacterized protein N7469_003989 [Penicillium citrinum]KAJ5234821.1 hypothetical protein N7469_003989 [Penicillium citrinum]
MDYKSPRSQSPSASSGFLRLGRRGSKGSLATTQTEREHKGAALDQIHNAAYQSDSLTHFNDFTSPPTPVSAQDDKGLSEELQGGVERALQSVQNFPEGPALKSPNSERYVNKSVSDITAHLEDLTPSHPTSSQGSRLQSPVLANFQHGQDAMPSAHNGKSSRMSSKSPSISSKASIPPSPGTKGNIAPLTKSNASSTAADPTITQLYVNAVGPDHRSRSSPVNTPSHGPKNMESPSIGGKDGPVDLSLSQSGSVLSQNLSHSPVLSAKTHESNHEDQNMEEPGAPSMSASQVSVVPHRKSSASADHPRLPDSVSQSALSRSSKQSDPTKETVAQSQENRANSRLSFSHDDPTALLNTQPKFSSQDSDSFRTEPAPESISHVPRDETAKDVPPKGTSSAVPSDKSNSTIANTKNRLPGYGVSRASTAESATTVSSLPPLNTALPRGSASLDNRAPTVGSDGVIPQLRNRLLSRDFWMRDESAKDCFYCGEPFTTFRRKHHCRTCGQIFDSKCTLLIPGTQFGQPGSIRVCKPCERMISAHDDDSSDFSDSEQSPIFMNPRISELNWGGARPSLVVDDDDTSSVISQSIDHVLRTPTMAIPATRRAGEGHNRRSAVLEINPDRSLARPTSSRSLRSSLGTRPHSISHKRHHSRQQYIRSFKSYHDDRAPFQRRHADDLSTESRLPAFHKDNIIDPDLAQYLSDDASSGDEQPSLLSAVTDGGLSKSGGDGERATFGGFLAAMKKGRSAFGERGAPSITQSGRDADDASISSSRAVNLPRSSRRRNLSVASSVHQRQSPRASKDSMFPQDISAPPVPFPVKLREGGFKMTRSSSMRGVGAPPVELNKASLEHVRKLLRQLLIAASVPNEDSWENALVPILLKTADEVDPDVQRGDDMDIRHYIKLKKIPGGRPGDTSYVSGLVFTKNLALKSMSRSIPCPNILILTFPLEYARRQQHFMSLEPVIRQEREFLENLVSRITELRPNLLLVENNVSGLALGLLEKAGIATAYNVKPSVLEAVSRCTQTRIVTSMDKLLTTELRSECSSFDVKTYVHAGRRKTYMYISGCPKELGCTIILRGAEEDVLAKVKHITEFMVYVVYNLRLETCLMRDEFAKLPASPMEVMKNPAIGPERGNNNDGAGSSENGPVSTDLASSQEAPSEKPDEEPVSQSLAAAETTEVPDDVPMPTYYDDMVKDHQTKILSTSPLVKFEPPYLLMRTREMERRLAYLKRLRDHDEYSAESMDEKTKPQKFMLITPEMVHQSPRDAPPKVKEVLRAAHDAEYDRVHYHYQTQKRQWEAYVAGNSNMFDPYSHQNIVVLYSLVCTETSVPCAGPDVFALEFYNEHGDDAMYEEDCTLGHFVQALCGSANHSCGVNGCEKLMYEHHRQYVHGDAQLSVMLQPYPSKLRGLQDTIMMWSVCKVCGNETQATLMSENTFKYSFGKYLELSFWGRNLHARAGVCPHDLQRDHLRYFGFKDVAVRIQYDKIHLLEIIVPRPRVTWKVDNDLKLRNEVYTRTEQRLSKFMLSVVARLKGINVESVVPELLDASKKEIDNLIKKAHEDHAFLVRSLQDRYNNSRYWEVIPLNEVLRAVQEKVVEWDTIFADFERNFFPSEKDIKRLATLQLKKIFLDKDATSEITDDPLHTPTDADDESTPSNEKPRLMRRMTLSPEKAKNVLVSVVEEHAGKKHRDVSNPTDPPPLDPQSEETALPHENIEGKQSSPQDEAVSKQEVRHLDLAVTSGHSQKSPPDALESSNVQAPSPNASGLAEDKAGDDPSKPSKSSPPKEIESSSPETKKVDSPAELQQTPPSKPSAIPRLTEGAFRRSGIARSPPLLRTQSQPAHIVRDKSFGSKPSAVDSNDPGTGNSRGEPNKTSDKRLTERLGFSALKNGRFAPGHSLIPRSTPKRGSNNVSSLARHFEQLSREFEKERQRERRQRARGVQSRAFPLASSKPIVEVYRNVREAVEEREPPVDEEDNMPFGPQLLTDASGRRSDEYLDRTDQSSAVKPQFQESPTEPFVPETIVRSDSQLMSEGEPEDNASDEERNTADGLHQVDSHEEVKIPDDDSIDFKDLAKHERTTLLKMLTNFWSERSASGWTALEYPLTVMDHVFADCDIIVREDEPSSLISFALDSPDYKEKLLSIQQRYDEMEEHQEDLKSGPESLEESRVEHALLRATSTHLKYQFQEGQAKMLCKVFYAEQFDALRKKCGVADRIVESLSRCAKWDSKGGKTKSIFLKTLDDRFILKSLSPIETQAFLKFAPAYFQIMSEALFHELPSAIAKMFGFYQVIIKNPSTGTEFNWFLLLMENLFYDRVPNRIFDLKGSMRNRKVQSTGERDEVLLDENMVDFIYETPLFAREHSKKLLGQSVWNDTLFLGRQNVMDYSLMIAIDDKRSELVVGIIDCIRTYTWDKKLESWIKDRGFAGSSRNRPTVTSPKEYKSRFREAMARYVLQAPSCWHQFQPSAMYRQPLGDQQTGNVMELESFDGNGEAGPLL